MRLSIGLLLALVTQFVFARDLQVEILVATGAQHAAFEDVIAHFQRANPQIVVKLAVFENETYKTRVATRLASATPPDVMSLFGGTQLADAASKGQLSPLADAWAQNDWAKAMTAAASSTVIVNGKPYGLPLSYYPWGIYYNKLSMGRAGVVPPKTFDELLSSCDALKKFGIAPVVVASKDLWPLAGWFDYLDLRINGLESHMQLLHGQLSWRSPQVTSVLAHWKQLFDHQCFALGHEKIDWRGAASMLYRGQAAMMLMGNFWASQIPDAYSKAVGFTPFPLIDANQADYEDAPTDVLVVPANAHNPQDAERLLAFLAQPDVQNQLTNATAELPAHKDVPLGDGLYLKETYALLGNTHGVAQFFDRDTKPDFSHAAMMIFQQFATGKLSINDTQSALEAARAKAYGARIKNTK